MGRAERNGTCKRCGGPIRHYPPPDGAGMDPAKTWAHLNRGDVVDDPHDPEPTAESLAAAGVR